MYTHKSKHDHQFNYYFIMHKTGVGRKKSNWQVREKKCGMHQLTQGNIHVIVKQHLNFQNDLRKKKIISNQMMNTLHHKSLQKTTTTIYKLS